jgi:tetratricopeptide (TPR) repeat protein
MGSKEVMATAPVMVFLYDRTFVSGSFREAWRRHRRFYPVLAATWLLLAFIVVRGGGSRGAAAGFGFGISSWAYALTQCRAVVMYLKLAVWPHPLVADYGTEVVKHPGEVALQAAVLLLLVAGTAVALWRRPVPGFLGAWFFVILAPSSSVIPLVTQTMAEHRMHLPLAAEILLAVTGGYLLAGRRIIPVFLALALVAGWLTSQRNADYGSELALWSDTVAKRPENARARVDLGIALLDLGRIADAVAQFEAAVRLQPENPVAQLNLGNACLRLGRAAEALEHGEAAVRLDPRNVDAKFNLGLALVANGRPGDALAYYGEVLRVQPDAADVRAALGNALRLLGDAEVKRQNWAAAVDRYRQALAMTPDDFSACFYLANSLLMAGQVDDAVVQYRKALALHPNDPAVQQNLAQALEWQRTNRAVRP